jgi:hypothetical protein
MGMLSNKTKTTVGADKAPRDRFILGNSDCYFESAQYLTGLMPLEKVKKLFANPVTELMGTKGKSLKVMFTTPDGEIKFMGFVTAGDATLELDVEHIPEIMEHVTAGPILVAVSPADLVAML